MSGDVTVGALKRESYLPASARALSKNGSLIAGQEWNNVLFSGGNMSNIAITGSTFTGIVNIAGLTNGSVLFANNSSQITQDANNFYIQDNITTPIPLAANTKVALSVGTNGDLTGADTLNIYAQADAYLPNSLITNSTVGLNTDGAFPGYTTSSSRGTGQAPTNLQTGDMVGGFSGWGYTNGNYQNLGAMVVSATGSVSGNLGGQIDFYTKSDGSTISRAMTIDNANGVTLQNGSTLNYIANAVGSGGSAGAALDAQSINLLNQTPAIVSQTQNTPSLHLQGQSWNTTAGASRQYDWKIFGQATNTTATSGALIIASQIDGAGYVQRFTMTSAGTTTFTSTVTSQSALITSRSNLVTTSTDGILQNNATAATAGVPVQYSPRLRFTGSAYNSAVPQSETNDFWIENRPVTAAGTTSANLVFVSRINGGSSSDIISLNSNGSTGFVGNVITTAAFVSSSMTSSNNDATLNFQSRNFTTTNPGVVASYGTYSGASTAQSAFQIKPIYNQTGTSSATDLVINRTETAIGSGTQRLIDAQVAGVSKFSVSNTGAVSAATLTSSGAVSGTTFTGTSFNGVALTTGGSANQFLTGAGTYAAAGGIVLGLALTTLPATASVDYSGLPAGCKRFTLNLVGAGISGSSNWLFQLRTSGGPTTSGYTAGTVFAGTYAGYTAGFGIPTSSNTNRFNGSIVFSLIDATTNTWGISSAALLDQAASTSTQIMGTVSLAGACTGIRLTTTGADTYGPGSYSITYEV